MGERKSAAGSCEERNSGRHFMDSQGCCCRLICCETTFAFAFQFLTVFAASLATLLEDSTENKSQKVRSDASSGEITSRCSINSCSRRNYNSACFSFA